MLCSPNPINLFLSTTVQTEYAPRTPTQQAKVSACVTMCTSVFLNFVAVRGFTVRLHYQRPTKIMTTTTTTQQHKSCGVIYYNPKSVQNSLVGWIVSCLGAVPYSHRIVEITFTLHTCARKARTLSCACSVYATYICECAI